MRTSIALLPLALAGLLIGGTAASFARESVEVLHLIVVSNAGSGGRLVSEMWIDEGRMLGLALDTNNGMTSRSSSGPDWLLDVPADPARPALKYIYENRPASTGVLHRVGYFRMALRSGQATVTREAGSSRLVADGSGNVAELRRQDDLPLWQVVNGTRVSFEYVLQEKLPAHAYPLAFFQDDGGRPTVLTVETDWPGVLRRASIVPAFPGSNVAGRELRAALYRRDPAGRTFEQVHLLYGEDVQVVTSQLARPSASVRSGGEPFVTALGDGHVFQDGIRPYAMVVRDQRVISVFGPTRDIVLQVAEALRE
jgi:hypothetical protein